MRILLLTILFIAPLYYFYGPEETTDLPEIDAVKLKMGAPKRVERALTVEKPVVSVPAALVEESATSESDENTDTQSDLDEPSEVSSEENDLEHVEEVGLGDIEEGWNSELKSMLNRLEPADGEEIHKTYLQEQESYQAELDVLASEKEQKTSPEAAAEVEDIMAQLDHKHQERLKEVLGAHYEAVRDHYEDYMESTGSEEGP